MEERLKPGDLLRISTECYSEDAIVQRVQAVQTNLHTGLLVDCLVPGYGEANSFFIPEGITSAGQAEFRRCRSGMPKDYVNKSGQDFKWDQYGEDISFQRKVVNAFVTQFDIFQNEGRGLYIYSKTKGSGKTMLSCCIANEILKFYDLSVKFVSIPDYIELVKDKSEWAKTRINTFLNAGLLIVDDIGATADEKEWISNAIFLLVNRRYEDMLPTIYTSNVQIDDLKCDDRIISRIYEVSIPLVMPEISIRRKKADQSNRDFLKRILDGGNVNEKK